VLAARFRDDEAVVVVEGRALREAEAAREAVGAASPDEARAVRALPDARAPDRRVAREEAEHCGLAALDPLAPAAEDELRLALARRAGRDEAHDALGDGHFGEAAQGGEDDVGRHPHARRREERVLVELLLVDEVGARDGLANRDEEVARRLVEVRGS
jgi:hypothetical protein